MSHLASLHRTCQKYNPTIKIDDVANIVVSDKAVFIVVADRIPSNPTEQSDSNEMERIKRAIQVQAGKPVKFGGGI
jgi:RNase H-fold protein (predicted Holliday junction resolvase)